MTPWCTVVVPLFNGENYLGELLSSITKSTYEAVNLLFIDDASTDRSVELVSSSRLSRVQLIRNEQNLGLYATLNKALDCVETDYVSLLFQDDVIEHTYFEKMRNLVNAYGCASFLWSAISAIDRAGSEYSRGSNTGRVEVIPPGVEAWRDAVRRGTFWIISGSMSKTERLRHYGFRTDLPHCADYDFLLRAIREDTFLYFESPLVKIRFHPGQASARNLAKSQDLVERNSIFRDQKSRFGNDFDLSLRIFTCQLQAKLTTRRAIGQAFRREFQQARSTLMIIPSIIHSTLLP
jgi:glycosyltransferase involved in cell wall biosynthesis